QDFVWLLLYSLLASFGPERRPVVIAVLVSLALFQVLESRIAFFTSGSRGRITAVLIKFGLSYWLIGVTDGIASSYYWILLLPVMSAAMTLGLTGTVVFTVLAGAAYLSFLLFLTEGEFIPLDQVWQVTLRVLFFPVVGYLTYELAEGNRVEGQRYQAAAVQLEAANQSLREAEAAMRRADRLAALGQLTAGLAHELRNPLGTMKTSAEMLTKQVAGENAVAREMAGYISTEVDRTNSLITRFLDFARPTHLRLAAADLGAILDRAIEQLGRHRPAYDVTIYKNYDPEIAPFPLDAELMERVFYNLVLNAAQASPAKGAITVKTRAVAGEVEIAVIDRGCGIERAHLENIFNPFFTTKSDGVGLGLAIVSNIVHEHGGNLTVESEPGQGSVFRVVLPAGSKLA
ncbi:MAG: ATP-binding protein, partial [Bryobacteraceae bacterium]